MQTSNLHPLAKGRDSIPPNLYSGRYLLGVCFTVPQSEFIPATRYGTTKTFTRKGETYCVPLQEGTPPSHRKWVQIGRVRSRDLYRAVS